MHIIWFQMFVFLQGLVDIKNVKIPMHHFFILEDFPHFKPI